MTPIGKPLAIALLATCLASPAAAQDYNESADFMLEHCRSVLAGRGSQWGSYCAGHVAGILLLGQFLVPTSRFCPPTGWTPQQGMRVVVAFLDANPHRLHQPFSGLAVEAMRAAWPCR